jgi:ParB/RepB/Spo0J family partition protein
LPCFGYLHPQRPFLWRKNWTEIRQKNPDKIKVFAFFCFLDFLSDAINPWFYPLPIEPSRGKTMPPEKENLPQVISVLLSKILLGAYNPRLFITPEAIDAKAASIKVLGQVTPVRVRSLTPGEKAKEPDHDYELVGGHIRYLAAQKLGLETLMAEVLDVQGDAAEIMAYMDNEGVEMTWLARYQFIERRLKAHPEVTKQALADQLGLNPSTISRAERVMGLLNKAARNLILQNLQTNADLKGISEILAYRLAELGDESKVEKALRVAIDRKMTEPEVKRLVNWVKSGGNPANYGKGTTDSKKGRKIDPNDPNGALWKLLPTWSSVGIDKKSNYDFRGKLDKFGGPYGIYCLMSGMAKYFQRVEKVRNPEAVPDNPYEGKLEELLEKGVREALADAARVSALRPQAEGRGLSVPISKSEIGEQKKYEAKKSKPFERPAASQGGPKKQDRKLIKGDGEAKDTPILEKRTGGPAEPVTEGELKTITDLLGNPDLKDNLKKMFGDMFHQP